MIFELTPCIIHAVTRLIVKFYYHNEGQDDDDDLDERPRSPAAGQSGEAGLGGLAARAGSDGRQHYRDVFWRIPARAGDFSYSMDR